MVHWLQLFAFWGAMHSRMIQRETMKRMATTTTWFCTSPYTLHLACRHYPWKYYRYLATQVGCGKVIIFISVRLYGVVHDLSRSALWIYLQCTPLSNLLKQHLLWKQLHKIHGSQFFSKLLFSIIETFPKRFWQTVPTPPSRCSIRSVTWIK